MLTIIILSLFLTISKTTISVNTASELFAGAGIITIAYDANNNQLETNCSTYDDCYMLLCLFLSDPGYGLITITPEVYKDECGSLQYQDERQIDALMYTNVNNNTYSFYNMSYASNLLCQFGKDKNIQEIDYFYIQC